jgi:hypothetical protein
MYMVSQRPTFPPTVACRGSWTFTDVLIEAGRNVAITPNKTTGMSETEVKKICHDYTLLGLQAMAEVANPGHPFRFIYTSGAMTERDQDKTLWLMSEHRKMRVCLTPDPASHHTHTNFHLCRVRWKTQSTPSRRTPKARSRCK